VRRGAVMVSGATVLTAPWVNPDTSGFIAFCNANDCVFAFTDAESAVLSATVADAHGSSTSLTTVGS
jgi:hypothetical protein